METTTPGSITSTRIFGLEALDNLIGCLVIYRTDRAGPTEVIKNPESAHLFIGKTEFAYLMPAWMIAKANRAEA